MMRDWEDDTKPSSKIEQWLAIAFVVAWIYWVR